MLPPISWFAVFCWMPRRMLFRLFSAIKGGLRDDIELISAGRPSIQQGTGADILLVIGAPGAIDPAYADRRTAQVECHPGFFCEGGIKRPCPSGTYGEASGLASDTCSGLCPRGYFCPEASLRPLRCAPGAYSTGGASDCTSCEVPASVPADAINSMCRDDRSCCLDVFG